MKKVGFFMAILLFLYLIPSIFGVGLSVYGIYIAEEIWLKLFCWFSSIVCLAGAVLVVLVIKIIYFKQE